MYEIVFYLSIFIGMIVYLYTPYTKRRDLQAIVVGLIFFLALTKLKRLKRLEKEGFYSPVAEPLQIDDNYIVNPIGWQWINNNTIKSIIRFHVTKGEFDDKNLVGRPGLGFPSKSDGFGYTNWNRLQGTNAWFSWNEGTGGTGWFWWTPSKWWHRLPGPKKRKILELDIFVTTQGVTPQFPIGYSITCPDYNFNRSTRVWLQFTYDPMARINPPDLPKEDDIKEIPQLMVKDPEIFIHAEGWTLSDPTLAKIEIPIFISQGEVDWAMTKGREKNRENGWFSWKIDPNRQNGDRLLLSGRLNRQATPPHLPHRYMVELKDVRRDRYVRVTITILNNPFVNNIGTKEKRREYSQRCPSPTETCTKMIRGSCQMPVLLRGQWQGISDNH